MKLEVFKNNFFTILKQRNAFLVFGIGMLLSNVILGLVLISREEKTYLVPPNLKQTAWVGQLGVSKEYLEEMSIYYVSLLLELSSSTAPYKRDLVLKHVAPEFYGSLKSRLVSEENRYAKEDLATSFRPVDINVDNQAMQVRITGDLISYIAGKKIKQTRDKYEMDFNYKFGELFLKKFELLESK